MTTEHMIQNGPPRPRFAIGLRGYDRAQVEAYLNEHTHWAEQAGGRIRQLEARVSELEGTGAPHQVQEHADRAIGDACRTVDRFVAQVDARTAEFERAVAAEAQPHIDELRRHVNDLEDERRTALSRLSRLRQSIERMGGQPIERVGRQSIERVRDQSIERVRDQSIERVRGQSVERVGATGGGGSRADRISSTDELPWPQARRPSRPGADQEWPIGARAGRRSVAAPAISTARGRRRAARPAGRGRTAAGRAAASAPPADFHYVPDPTEAVDAVAVGGSRRRVT